MKIEKFSIEGENVREILDFLRSEFPLSYNYVSHDSRIAVFILERYTYIQNSNLSVAIILDIIDDFKCDISIVVSGGKIGIFRLDVFGLEDAMLKSIKSRIEKFCSEKNMKLRENVY